LKASGEVAPLPEKIAGSSAEPHGLPSEAAALQASPSETEQPGRTGQPKGETSDGGDD
jgi:hypothetical protein